MTKKSISELLEFSILNIDKPSGPTSFRVDEIVKKKLVDVGFDIRKTSHFGTLDPKVTGVLPIALNRACKLSEFFMHKDKTYIGVFHLHENVSKADLEKAMKGFQGKIKQLPPKKSRVKRQERVREIKKFEILEKAKKDVLFLAEVEAGTYIRKLVHDLGESGLGGAHMTELRRIQAGIFSEKDSSFINLYDFAKAVNEFEKDNENKLRKILIPAEQAIKEVMPAVQVKSEKVKQLLTGKPLMKQDLINKKLPNSGVFAVFQDKKFIGVYKKSNEKEIIARTEFVFN